MKNFKLRFVALCGLMALGVVSLVPIVAKASCPCIPIECSNGKLYCCSGTEQGTSCVYDRSCLNGGRCGGGGGDVAPEEPANN